MSKKEKEKEVNEVSEAITKEKQKKNFKKLKFGSVSVVTIILVIAIVIAANIVCGLLMKRYPVKFDLTPDSRHEITDETIEVLKANDKDIDIIVTTTEDYFTAIGESYERMFYQYYGIIVDCPYEIIPEILDKYSVYAESGKGSIKVKYVDITKNPDVVSDLNQYYNGEISEGGIAVKCGEKVRFITPEEVAGMITPSQDSNQNNIRMVFAGESIITSAVKAVSDSNTVRAAVVASMNGNAIIDNTHSAIASSLESFLAKNGYDCVEVDIGTDSLSPDDYDLLVVACPGIDFTEDIIAKMSDFLYNGGSYQKNMIYIPSLYATNIPNITEFLADWKIQIEPSVIFDESSMVQVSVASIGQVTYAPMVQIANSEAVGTITNEALPIVAPQARPITVISKNNESIVTEIVKSSATSYTASLLEGNEVSDERMSYNVVVKSRKETSSGLDVYGSNILVIGSPFMLDSIILSGTTTYNNANVVLNVVNDMTGKGESTIIPEKALEQYTLSLTTTSARAILVIVVVVIPLIIGMAGLIVLLWRKNK